jgi:hypothetical protein
VIGDTPRDIACAHADGVRCFAVATGPFRPDQLKGGDVVARDALGLRAALREALSTPRASASGIASASSRPTPGPA